MTTKRAVLRSAAGLRTTQGTQIEDRDGQAKEHGGGGVPTTWKIIRQHNLQHKTKHQGL